MQKQKVQLPEMILVGLAVRTNNQNEMNPETSKIGELSKLYWNNQVANSICHRIKPNITYSVYTNYESDEHGDYTYFIGEAVDSFQNQDLETFKTLVIPASTYQKFTTEPGKMPEVVISAWQAIWRMDENDLGGKRQYVADFETHDEKSLIDPNHAVVNIYIGIKE